ncbi:hypothetical protein HMPREF1619_00884 [Klebsiella pneumoniae 909957]|nr:hypothetical protein HMPREF9538_02174 [Klebsiella sp. MS 92-3]ESB02835.1 hypothetical protein HMPREF1619_00884 [Klebsiella pneumoniae 909957]KXA19883.1 hypothetical protein HMPREF3197_05601 [Klebsiella pneumoniae]
MNECKCRRIPGVVASAQNSTSQRWRIAADGAKNSRPSARYL